MPFHINDKGEPGVCRAASACPFGGADQHFASPASARTAYESGRTSINSPLSKTPQAFELPDVTADKIAKLERHWAMLNEKIAEADMAHTEAKKSLEFALKHNDKQLSPDEAKAVQTQLLKVKSEVGKTAKLLEDLIVKRAAIGVDTDQLVKKERRIFDLQGELAWMKNELSYSQMKLEQAEEEVASAQAFARQPLVPAARRLALIDLDRTERDHARVTAKRNGLAGRLTRLETDLSHELDDAE